MVKDFKRWKGVHHHWSKDQNIKTGIFKSTAPGKRTSSLVKRPEYKNWHI
jgi:hypothetical protein